MFAFLAWITILHFLSNELLFPFFKLIPVEEEFSWSLAATASGFIWASELLSSFLARKVCWWVHGVRVRDVSQIYIDHPDLLPASTWTICHVLMDSAWRIAVYGHSCD